MDKLLIEKAIAKYKLYSHILAGKYTGTFVYEDVQLKYDAICDMLICRLGITQFIVNIILPEGVTLSSEI